MGRKGSTVRLVISLERKKRTATRRQESAQVVRRTGSALRVRRAKP